MTTVTIKGQFTKGKAQKIKKPNAQKMVIFDNDLPKIYPNYKIEGHILPKQGAL